MSNVLSMLSSDLMHCRGLQPADWWHADTHHIWVSKQASVSDCPIGAAYIWCVSWHAEVRLDACTAGGYSQQTAAVQMSSIPGSHQGELLFLAVLLMQPIFVMCLRIQIQKIACGKCKQLMAFASCRICNQEVLGSLLPSCHRNAR